MVSNLVSYFGVLAYLASWNIWFSSNTARTWTLSIDSQFFKFKIITISRVFFVAGRHLRQSFSDRWELTSARTQNELTFSYLDRSSTALTFPLRSQTLTTKYLISNFISTKNTFQQKQNCDRSDDKAVIWWRD